MRLLIPSLVLSAFATPAMAFFVGGTAPAAPPPEVKLEGMNVVADRTLLSLNHIGSPDAEVAGLPAGYNAGVAMDHAFKLILPEGWRAALSSDIGKDQQVSWSNGLTWLEAAQQIAVQTDSAANIHWANKVVTLTPMPRESSMVQVVHAGPTDVTVDVYDQTGTVIPSDVSPVLSSPGAVMNPPPVPGRITIYPEREFVPVVTTAGYTPMQFETEPTQVRSNRVEVLPIQRYAAPEPVASSSAVVITSMAPVSPPAMEAVVVTEAPIEVAVVGSALSPVAGKKDYRDLGEFLSEDVRVDKVGLSLTDTIGALIPSNWTVDVRDEQKVLDNLRIDLTFVGARGAALNAIGTRENLVLIPYIEFSKIVVTRGQLN